MSTVPQFDRKTVKEVADFAHELRERVPAGIEMIDVLAMMYVAECSQMRQTPHEAFSRLSSAALHLQNALLRQVFKERADAERRNQ
jgi:hypothetical protein